MAPLGRPDDQCRRRTRTRADRARDAGAAAARGGQQGPDGQRGRHGALRRPSAEHRRRGPQRAGRAPGRALAVRSRGPGMRRPPKPSHEDILWLQEYLPYRLAVVATRMLREAARVYKTRRNPLTTAQWRVLAILANHEPLTATEICRISMLDKVAISR